MRKENKAVTCSGRKTTHPDLKLQSQYDTHNATLMLADVGIELVLSFFAVASMQRVDDACTRSDQNDVRV